MSKVPLYTVHDQCESGEAQFHLNTMFYPYPPLMYMLQTGLRMWIAVYDLEEVKAAVALSAAAPSNSDLTMSFVAFDSIVVSIYSQSLSLTIPHLPAGKYCVTFGFSSEIPSTGGLEFDDIINAHQVAIDITCASPKPMRTCIGQDTLVAVLLSQDACLRAVMAQKALSLLPGTAKDIMGHPYMTPLARKYLKFTNSYNFNFSSCCDHFKTAFLFDLFSAVLMRPFIRFQNLALTSLVQDLPLHTTVANAVEVSSRNALRELMQVEPRNVGGMFEFCNYFVPFKGM